MIYVAYGSNMMQDAMRSRTPDATLIGMGTLEGYRLEFYVHATVEASESAQDHVPVAVWEISSRDEDNLDWYEGYPEYYRKETCTVHMNDGSEIDGTMYVMNEEQYRNYEPGTSYYNGIVEAYEELGLHEYVSRILAPALQRSANR